MSYLSYTEEIEELKAENERIGRSILLLGTEDCDVVQGLRRVQELQGLEELRLEVLKANEKSQYRHRSWLLNR